MKGKRIAVLALAAALTMSLLVLPAGAVNFTDMKGHWAREDVEYLAGLGVINGTSTTTFSPTRQMTACEALLFCSRTTGVSAADKKQIAADRADQLKKILPKEVYSWAAEEMAVCLETGTISEPELEAMCTSGALLKSITRENLAMYLVRAMQLDSMAENLTSYSLNYADTASISEVLKPYVYLLSTYGIVQGNSANQFMPKGSLTRAEMATMLRRAMDFTDTQGIYAELPAYTTYAWTGGTITSVSTASDGTTSMVLSSNISGVSSLTLPASAFIYENNMRTTPTALRQGQYVRVNLDSAGNPQSARLGGSLTALSGTVSAIDQGSISLLLGGVSKRLTIDRFTKVQVGQLVGDPSLIDPDAGYTQAQCWVDSMGHLAELKLSGGTRPAEGLITGVENTAGGQTLTITAFNGQRSQYTLASGAGVTIDGKTGSISMANQGDRVSLRVSNDNPGSVVSAAVDTVSNYVQGPIKSVNFSKEIYEITVEDSLSGKSRTYPIASNAIARYDGEEITVREVARNNFATLQISGGQVMLLNTYPGSTTTQGVIESITYASPTTLAVRTPQGTTVTFSIDLTNLPDIERDGKTSSIDKLRSGDSVTVTVRYNEVYEIEATSQNATLSGTITRVVQDTSGVSIDVRFSDGSSDTYQVSEGVSVTQKGSVISLYALKPNDAVDLTISGNEIVAIEVTGSSSSSTQITGSVLVVNTKEKTMMISLEDGTPLTVDVDDASFVTISGSSTSLSKLAAGDRVQLYGQYYGSVFTATLVVKL